LVFRRACERPIDAALAAILQDQLVQAVLLVELELGFEIQLGLLDRFHQFLEFFLVCEVRFLFKLAFGEELNKFRIAQTAAEFGGHLVVLLNVEQELRECAALERLSVLAFDDVLLGGALHELAGEFALVADVAIHLAALHAIERRLRDIDVAFINQLAHVTEEKGEQQRANVAAVHVRVGHKNHFVIAQLRRVEIIFADAGAERGDDAADFFVAEHLVVAGFLDIQNLTFERQDGLVAAVAAAFGRSAGGFSLDDEEFAAGRIALLAIGELPREARRIESGFSAREFARFPGGFARAGGVNALANDFSRDRGVFVEIFAELFVDELFDEALDVAIELAFGLSFELRLRQLDGNDGNKAFADVVTSDGDFVLLLFQHAGGAVVEIDGAGERGTEAGKMRAAVNGVDGVGKGDDIFGVAVVVLQRDFHVYLAALALHIDRGIVERLLAAIE